MVDVRPQLLTVRQVSIIIQAHRNTVLNYLHEGKLQGHNPNGDKKGLRITMASVADYMKKYLLENFDEKTFAETIQTAINQPVPKQQKRRIISQGI